jgi:hypothetical protein
MNSDIFTCLRRQHDFRPTACESVSKSDRLAVARTGCVFDSGTSRPGAQVVPVHQPLAAVLPWGVGRRRRRRCHAAVEAPLSMSRSGSKAVSEVNDSQPDSRVTEPVPGGIWASASDPGCFSGLPVKRAAPEFRKVLSESNCVVGRLSRASSVPLHCCPSLWGAEDQLELAVRENFGSVFPYYQFTKPILRTGRAAFAHTVKAPVPSLLWGGGGMPTMLALL